jgi:hypothetical protein
MTSASSDAYLRYASSSLPPDALAETAAFCLLPAVVIRAIPAPRNGYEARFSSLGAG